MGKSDKCQIGESNQSGGGKPLSIPLREYEIRPRKDEAHGPTCKQAQFAATPCDGLSLSL